MNPKNRGVAVVLTVVGVIAAVLVLRLALRGGPDVVLLGDSITFQTAAVFDETLGEDWDLTTHGVPMMRADQLLPDVPSLAGQRPEQVVINLGTNDVLRDAPLAQTEAALEQLGDGFPTARCVHLVTINEHMVNAEGADLSARAAELNGRIRDLAARRGWRTVPWDALVRLYEAGEQPEGPVTTDSVHPSPYGEHLLADAYAKALDEC